MNTPDVVTNVRAAMIHFASHGQSFDAARLATTLNVAPAQVEPPADYVFWMGALTPFRYRRQTRTGLSPLYSRFTGELPGVFAEAPPPDARPPESMPAAWRVEVVATEHTTGVLFCNGERAAFEIDRAAHGLRVGDYVCVRWRRSPTGHFNIVDGVELAEQVPGGRPAFKALARVLRVEDAPPARPTLVVVDENGVTSSLPASSSPKPGDVVEITWGFVDAAPGCVPLSFRTLEQAPRRFTLGKWLEVVEQSIEESVPHLEELAGQEVLTNASVTDSPDDPFRVLREEDLNFGFSANRTWSEAEGLPE